MPIFKKKNLRRLGISFIIVAPFFFLSSALLPWTKTNPILAIWQDALFVAEYGLHSVLNFTVNLGKQYVFLVGAQKENAYLKKELDELRAEQMLLKSRMQDVDLLREQLKLSKKSNDEIVFAEVVSGFRNYSFQSLRLNKGKNHKVDSGMPVISGKGVVGKVLRAGFLFSDVQLITDHNFSLDVMVERTRIRGITRGLGGNLCRLQLNVKSDIKIGDTIITSGIVGSFPKGLAVGQVVKISYESDNITKLVTIETWEDTDRLEEAMVLLRNDPDMEQMRSIVGESMFEQTSNRYVD